MCLAQGHNAVTPVKLKPATRLSRVKHSTTDPLGSLIINITKLWWHLCALTLMFLHITETDEIITQENYGGIFLP